MGLKWERTKLIFVFGGIAAIILFFLFTFIDLGLEVLSDEVGRPYDYKSPVKVIEKNLPTVRIKRMREVTLMFGSTELIVIVLIIFILFGAKSIPKFAKSIGEARKEFQKTVNDKKI